MVANDIQVDRRALVGRQADETLDGADGSSSAQCRAGRRCLFASRRRLLPVGLGMPVQESAVAGPRRQDL